MSLVLGAYAAMSRGLADDEQESVYAALAANADVGGFEFPFKGKWSDADVELAAARLPPTGRAVLTTIPGLIQRAAGDPALGPASTDEQGRRAGVDFVLDAYDAAERLSQLIGADRLVGVAMTSSPRSGGPDPTSAREAFRRSLIELAERTPPGVTTIVEHCDAFVASHEPAKGFLPLEVELELVGAADWEQLSMGLNWGRSAIEGRSADHALGHVRLVREAGLLQILVFSGCSPEPSSVGAGWADGHLPSTAEEPTSLLGPTQIAASIDLAGDAVIGLKVAPPPAASADERVSLVLREARLVQSVRRSRS